MTLLRAPSAFACRLALALVALALLVRVAVPVGFMPQSTERGVVISLCTPQGAVNVLVKTGQGHKAPEKHQGDESPCSFGMGLAAGVVAPLPAVLAGPVLLPASLAQGAAIADLTVNRLAAPPPPSQGPPARA